MWSRAPPNLHLVDIISTVRGYVVFVLFQAVARSWAEERLAAPGELVDAVELVVNPCGTPPPMKKGTGSPWDLKLAEVASALC
jgi:hypothetical protein